MGNPDEWHVEMSPLAAEQLEAIRQEDPEAYERIQAFLELAVSDPVSAQMISEPVREEDLPPEVRQALSERDIKNVMFRDI
jgi:hypothetical protein